MLPGLKRHDISFSSKFKTEINNCREHVLEVYDPEDEPTTAIWHPRVKQKRVTLTQVE